MSYLELPRGISRLLRLGQAAKPSLAEQQARIEETLKKYPLTNRMIWFSIMSGNDGHISETQRQAVVDAYLLHKEPDSEDNTSVAAILKTAHMGGFEKDPFFQNVCFNYDSIFTALERYNQAIADLQAGNRKSVPFSPEYWPIGKWIKSDFEMLLRDRAITQLDGFNRRLNAQETVFWINSPRDLLYLAAKQAYTHNVVPFLGESEIVKPGIEQHEDPGPTPTTIARRSNSHYGGKIAVVVYAIHIITIFWSAPFDKGAVCSLRS